MFLLYDKSNLSKLLFSILVPSSISKLSSAVTSVNLVFFEIFKFLIFAPSNSASFESVRSVLDKFSSLIKSILVKELRFDTLLLLKSKML